MEWKQWKVCETEGRLNQSNKWAIRLEENELRFLSWGKAAGTRYLLFHSVMEKVTRLVSFSLLNDFYPACSYLSPNFHLEILQTALLPSFTQVALFVSNALNIGVQSSRHLTLSETWPAQVGWLWDYGILDLKPACWLFGFVPTHCLT